MNEKDTEEDEEYERTFILDTTGDLNLQRD